MSLENEEAGVGIASAVKQCKRRDTLFLVGMILVLAAYLSPFDFRVYLRDFQNASKGTICNGFDKPRAYYAIIGMIVMIRHAWPWEYYIIKIFDSVTIVSAIAGLVANFVIKNEHRRFVTRAICSMLVVISIAAWFVYVLSTNRGLGTFAFCLLLEILGAVCALISLFTKPKDATKSAGVSSEKNGSPEQSNISLGGLTMQVSYVKCPGCGAAVELGTEHCPKCDAKIPMDAEANYWKCPACGAAVSEKDESCPKCSTRREKSEEGIGGSIYSSGGGGMKKLFANANSGANIGTVDKPISMWGYFGYEILYSIPIVGFIAVIYNALAAKNQNVKNFARSYFCLYIILAVLCLFCKGLMQALMYKLF